MTRIFVFYHIYCNDITINIVKQQINKIINSGLYQLCNNIFCFLAGDPDYLHDNINFILSKGDKFVIADIGYGDTSYERFTLLKIKNYIQPQDKFLYIHSKGITRSKSFLPVNDWRNLMEYFLITKHKDCLIELSRYSVVGVNFKMKPRPHFSGNFWWCRGEHFLRLPHKIGSAYCAPEFYIMRIPCNYLNVYSSNCKHYKQRYPPQLYVKNEGKH